VRDGSEGRVFDSMGIPIEEDMDASIQQFKAAASIAN